MSSLVVRPCGCPRCRDGEPHPDRVVHQHINLLVARLDEQQRRWFVALEAERLGHGGDTLLAQITGLNRRTIRRGRRELAAGLAERPAGRIRAPGGGRPAREAQDPGLLPTLEALLAPPPAYGSLRHRFAGRKLRGGGGWTRTWGWAGARRSAPGTLAETGPRPSRGGGCRHDASRKRCSACCGARTWSWSRASSASPPPS